MSEEIVVFWTVDQQVWISNKRVLLIGVTYPISNISSVRVVRIPPDIGHILWFLIFAALVLVMAVVELNPPGITLESTMVALLVILIGGIGLYTWFQHDPALRTRWGVRLATSGVEVDGIIYRQRDPALQVLQAVNHAIALRA